jgi:undecaprenyl diphosphate synthase
MSEREDGSISLATITGEPGEAAARHVAIICDRNARWARAHAPSVTEGHRAATNRVVACVRDTTLLGVQELTICSFSDENWSRAR